MTIVYNHYHSSRTWLGIRYEMAIRWYFCVLVHLIGWSLRIWQWLQNCNLWKHGKLGRFPFISSKSHRIYLIMSQLWSRLWICADRQQAITWSNDRPTTDNNRTNHQWMAVHNYMAMENLTFASVAIYGKKAHMYNKLIWEMLKHTPENQLISDNRKSIFF